MLRGILNTMPGKTTRAQIAASARNIVVKVGTNVLCDADGRLVRRAVSRLAKQVADAVEAGRSVVLVASGAIGAGVGELDLPGRPRNMPMLQAAAAVGQGQLMRTFHDVFGRYGLKVAQVLLTRDAFEDRTRYLNIRNTLSSLHDCGVLPIVNENDTVAIDEIRFGDNDVLAALVANMLGADLLVCLTNVEGVMKDGQVLDVIERVDEETMALATGERSRLGSGGMESKLQAADMVTRAGGVVAVAGASQANVLGRLLAGEAVGTVFVPARRRMSSRRRWIGQAARTTGKVFIDAGAAKALSKGGKSLLPSGITAVDGNFSKGATVAVMGPDGKEVARGLANYSARQIHRIMGLRTGQIAGVLGDKPYDEVIHRNNMALR